MVDVMNTIRKLREERGFTQAELSRFADVSMRTIQNVEAGKPTTAPTRRKLLRALGLNYEQDAGWVFGHENCHRFVLMIDDHCLDKLKTHNGCVMTDDPEAELAQAVLNAHDKGSTRIWMTEKVVS